MKKFISGVAALAAMVAFLASTVPVHAALEPGNQYNPSVNVADFTTVIDNPYFSLPIGKKMVYESKTPDGLERIEILVPGWKKTVMGVETLVMWDRVYVDGQIIEDTRDYLAQRKQTGDVWYFGEDVDNYEDGKLVDHEGAWIAGVDGAKAGVWFPGSPRVGYEYRQEYYEGKAEDAARIDSVSETVTVPAGTFTGCVKVFEYSPLFTATAHKYHCQQVGGVALEVDLPDLPDSPTEQRSELGEVDLTGALGQKLPAAYQKEGVVTSAGDEVAEEQGEDEDRDFLGDREEADEGEAEEDNDFLAAGIAGVVGVIIGVVLQKYVLGRREGKVGSGEGQKDRTFPR